MKYLVFSDVHGSAKYLEMILDVFRQEKCDKLICLGDYLYHGPRNPLPEGYDTQKCIQIFKEFKDSIIAIRGNCDALIDEELLDLNMKNYLILDADGVSYFLTHGHIYNEDKVPERYEKGNNILIGHFHEQKNHRKNGYNFLSPGSISLPKNNSKRGYIIIDNGQYKFYDLLTKSQIII